MRRIQKQHLRFEEVTTGVADDQDQSSFAFFKISSKMPKTEYQLKSLQVEITQIFIRFNSETYIFLFVKIFISLIARQKFIHTFRLHESESLITF